MSKFHSFKSFIRVLSRDKLVEDGLLNLLGIQIPRIVTARFLYRIKLFKIQPELKEKVRDLRSNGLLVWQDFLPADEFEALSAELSRLLVKENQWPSNREDLFQSHPLKQFGPSTLPETYKFFSNATLRQILEAAEKRVLAKLHTKAAIQLIKYGPGNDPQTKLHSDTWFNTHKIWFYLDDVEIKDGPLIYVKKSHRLTLTQLVYVYRSCRRNDRRQGSRSISEAELARQALRETAITCPRNTLVIANTYGYHRRLPRSAGGKRLSLHVALRDNPFVVYGLGKRLADQLRKLAGVRLTETSPAKPKPSSRRLKDV